MDWLTGLLLIVLPVAYNLFFFLLGRTFGYPDILRQPTAMILGRFQAGGSPLRLLWHGFALTAVALAPAAVLLGQVLGFDDFAVVPVATMFGVLAAVVQALGLVRWGYLVPDLARRYSDPAASPATRDSVEVVFQGFHRMFGVAIGEHFGFLFTGLWTTLVSIAMLQSPFFDGWLAWPGIAIGATLVIGSAEFAGPFEETGWELAGRIVPIAYGLWSLWLIATGATLLLR